MSSIRVLLVDDHNILRDGLKLLLGAQKDMEVVGDTDRGRGVVDFLRAIEVDVIVMDVSMPDAAGPKVTTELRQEFPNVKVLALTRHTEKAYIQQMLHAGATGYVLKQTSSDVLLSAIRAVAEGGTFIDPAVAGKLVDSFGARTSTAQPGSVTSREQQILTMVAYGHTNKEIAGALGITVKTVETHKTNIMQKLDITSRAELVRYAMAQGWLT
jgi:two-component system response regulator NreC